MNPYSLLVVVSPIVFIFGSVVGSFLSVCIARLPEAGVAGEGRPILKRILIVLLKT